MAKNDKKKIIMALSGGVDSAVAVALLKKRGFEIVGVFFRFFDPPRTHSRTKEGRSAGELIKVKKIAEKLNIPLEIVDARKEFKEKIIKYFISSYKKGITPNPCVICNKEMKIRLLFDLLKKHKADFAATGHYARLGRDVKSQKSKVKDKEDFSYKLLEAKDKTKDQSYFLYKLSQQELAKIIFPLGDRKKTDVKKIAKKLELPVLSEESQDICFLADKDINQFLRRHIKAKAGNIVDEQGKTLARHKGLPFYTIGQRKGIEIGGAGPFFVVAKNSMKNALIVTDDPKKLLVKKFFVRNVTWIGKSTKLPLRADIQIRYHAPKISAIIRKEKSGKFSVESKKLLRAVTPGQSAVFYKGEEILGGGIID